MKRFKPEDYKGISQIIFPILIFIISFTFQIVLSLYLEEFDFTENLFHSSVVILFIASLFHYKNERVENKIHYIISYWIVAIIFFAKFLFKIMWYFI